MTAPARAEDPEQVVDAAVAVEVGVAGLEGLGQDRILGDEAGQRRNAGDGDGRHQEGPVGRGHVFLEPAHLAHVLLAAAGVDHRARPEEEQALKKAWVTTWKIAAT